ncbi:DUF1800 domain-containing protein [Photobacterium profundum]|uniref:Uncharacterized protein conserved in bacteria n=1 Tax=Photobacterium profundum 3TCK TaxID=314280 RepID=Q1Z8Y9_9GAMM|nr:DUF1800 family protein [Photobacterium profundum]EAS44969.1 Uncharacterized protein conserved in bacteria [Photobacterium profundum 3TCK]PSV60052.1 DUF1800 domain-containing protein [Photobacterium profundum]
MEGLTYRQASRFLDMATMGIKKGDVDTFLAVDDRSAWIDAQFVEPYASHLNQTNYQAQQRGKNTVTQEMRVCAWFDIALWQGAQLRQRMAFALSQILVVGDRDAQLAPYPADMASFYDLLTENAFSNYRDLLEKVTRSPVMGLFLTLEGNKAESVTGQPPDQNYAREVMQLFSLGLHKLNLDGTYILDNNGIPEDTYTDDDIDNLARLFTGWEQDGNNLSTPMVINDMYHDMGNKRILNHNFPEGVGAEQELQQFLDVIMAHQNTAPFISTLLIKRFVTSNPTPAYVERVSNTFINTNGELGAVIKAILTDPEVLKENSINIAKMREPLLAMTYFYRAMDAYPGQSGDIVYDTMNYQDTFSQYPLGSPSVFNFFSPDHSPQGYLMNAGLTAPEFELIDWSQIIKISNVFYRTALDYGQNRNKTNNKKEMYIAPLDMEEAANNEDKALLLSLVRNRFLHGEIIPELEARLSAIYDTHDRKYWAVPKIIFFALISPNFMVQE